MRYIGKFATQNDVEAAIDDERLLKPYVAYVQDGEYIDWNTYEHDYSKDYLTFEIISAGTIVWKTESSAASRTIEYSLDSGETWSSITSTLQGVIINVDAGDKVMFRGNNSTYSVHAQAPGSMVTKWRSNGFTGSTASFNAYGNIMCLITPSDFDLNLTFTSSYNFYHFFEATNIIDASNLILPATTLAAYCYSSMFSGCTSLISTPELPATTLKSNCYSYMFQGCTSLTSAPVLPASALVSGCYYEMFNDCTHLNSVKALFTTTPTTAYASNWLAGVSSTGTFYKNPSATWDQSITRGASTVPTNWTITPAQ